MVKPKPKRKAEPPQPVPAADDVIVSLADVHRQNRIIFDLHSALGDLLHYYDKLDGHAGELGVGWSAVDVKRLGEIRDLCR